VTARPHVVIPDDTASRYAGNPDELLRLRAVAEVTIHGDRPTPAALAERIRDADIVLSFRPAFTRFPREVLQSAPRLRFICIAGAGVEDVDVAYASSRGIAVGNVVGNKRALAEHCLALLFAVARRIAEQDRAIRRGVWQPLQGIELGGKTLGIVGLSAIAREFAPLARALGMEVLSWSRDNSPERAAAVGATAAPLEDVLGRADVVSLHLRLFPELQGFLSRERIAQMKHGAILLNTARGELIDEAALVEALRTRRLSGAGLDVFTQVPLPAGHPLLAQDNVVMTPSSAWNTVDAAQRNLRRSIDNVLAFLQGEPASITNTAALGRQ
jgi:D-3-phosphoglycerate dehydrogenase / 2-oxoglutarate reductase